MRKVAVLLYCLWFLIGGVAAASDKPELHLLVDVSGSMKRTDPKKLRIQAIKMFIFLLNNQAKMSLTSFATQPKTIMTTQEVNSTYLNTYLRTQHEITSNGAWTNINAALRHANRAWSSKRKVIILLTDGKVDIGSNELDTQSTQDLYQNVLPQLKKERVQVFCIGFSQQADKLLLQNIANQTNALSSVIDSSDGLDETIFSLFNAIIKPQSTVKSSDSSSKSMQINIDPKIKEMTIVYRHAGSPHLFTLDPLGHKSELTLRPGQIQTEHFSFIRIQQPEVGTWQLFSSPENIQQLLILTDVQLKTNLAAGLFFKGQRLVVEGWFTEEDKLLDNELFNGSKVALVLKNKNNDLYHTIPYKASGHFSKTLFLNIPVGTYQATLTGVNQLFSREQTFPISVHESPFSPRWGADCIVSLTLLNNELIDPGSVSFNLNGTKVLSSTPYNEQSMSWLVDFNRLGVQQKGAFMSIDALTSAGVPVHFELPVASCKQLDSSLVPIQPAAASLSSSIAPLKQRAIKGMNSPEQNVHQNKKQQVRMGALILVFAGTLLILLILIVLVVLSQTYQKKINHIRDEL